MNWKLLDIRNDAAQRNKNGSSIGPEIREHNTDVRVQILSPFSLTRRLLTVVLCKNSNPMSKKRTREREKKTRTQPLMPTLLFCDFNSILSGVFVLNSFRSQPNTKGNQHHLNSGFGFELAHFFVCLLFCGWFQFYAGRKGTLQSQDKMMSPLTTKTIHPEKSIEEQAATSFSSNSIA